MAFKLTVHAIDSPLTDHQVVPGRCRICEFNFTDEVFRLKEKVEKAFGIPAKDQRYHGLWFEYDGEMLRFHGDRILQHCDDDDSLYTVLQNLYIEGIMDSKHTIAVVRIPPPFHTPKVNWSSIHRRRQPSQFHDEGGNDSDSEVEVLRNVDTVQERIDAGRDNAIVVGDDDDSSEGGEEEEEQPRQKRARRANGESETEPQAWRDGNGIGEEEQDQEREAANEDNDGEEEEADEAEEVRADNEIDEGDNTEAGDTEEGDEGGIIEAGDAEEAAAADGENVQAAAGENMHAPAPEGPPALSELRRWLRGLHADGRHVDAFDAYAAAFEREFRSPEDLALAADNAPEGLEGILHACGVRTFGDKARLRWAISGLPRPVRPADVDMERTNSM